LTFCIQILAIMTFYLKALNIMTFSITRLTIMAISISIKTQHWAQRHIIKTLVAECPIFILMLKWLYAECLDFNCYSECCHAECLHAEYRFLLSRRVSLSWLLLSWLLLCWLSLGWLSLSWMSWRHNMSDRKYKKTKIVQDQTGSNQFFSQFSLNF
jgi:hypothetical protein